MASDAVASLEVVLRLLRADAPAAIADEPGAWPRWAVLLPHVLAAAGRASGAPPGPGDQTRGDVSWLLDRAAVYLRVHARPAEARPLAERALAVAEAAHGPDHPAVGAVLNNLALILQDLGETAATRPLAERALAVAEGAHGPDHPAVGIRLGNLAMTLRAPGEAAAARPLAERALAITAAGRQHLALTLQDLGEAAAARPLAERALAITAAAYGPDHPDVGTALNNLAGSWTTSAWPARPTSGGNAYGTGQRAKMAATDTAPFPPPAPSVLSQPVVGFQVRSDSRACGRSDLGAVQVRSPTSGPGADSVRGVPGADETGRTFPTAGIPGSEELPFQPLRRGSAAAGDTVMLTIRRTIT